MNANLKVELKFINGVRTCDGCMFCFSTAEEVFHGTTAVARCGALQAAKIHPTLKTPEWCPVKKPTTKKA